MRILHVGAFPFPLHQGSQVYASGLAQALARRGHEVWLAAYPYGRGAWPESVHRVDDRTYAGPRPTASGPNRSKLRLDLRLGGAVRRAVRRHGIELIHAHNVEAPFVAWLARTGVPVLYGAHTSLAEELPSYVSVGRRPAAWAGAVVDAVLARSARVSVALSPHGAERLRAAGARRVIVAPPGVRFEELQGGDAATARDRWGLGTDPWVFYGGNSDAYQDLDVLLRAVAGQPALRLLLVTGSPLEPLADRARDAGIAEDRLRLVGSTRFADTLDAMAASVLAALPRTVCSGFPMKLLNTLGAGLPTVVAAGTAQPIAGVVEVPDQDADAMGEALVSLVTDPSRRHRLGAKARDAIREDWSWDVRAEEMERVYRDLIA